MENTSLGPSRLDVVLSVVRGEDGQGLRAFPLPRQSDTSGWSYEEPSKTGSFLLVFIPAFLLFINGALWVGGFSELALVLFCLILVCVVVGFIVGVLCVRKMLTRSDIPVLSDTELAELEILEHEYAVRASRTGSEHAHKNADERTHKDADAAREARGTENDEISPRLVELRNIRAVSSTFGRESGGPMSAFAALVSGEAAQRIKKHNADECKLTVLWLNSVVFETVHLTVESGTELVAHRFTVQPKSDKWIIFFHGYTGTWNEGILYARRWAQAGYNVLLPEMRAHGASGGRFIGMGWLDRRDAVAWSKWLIDNEGTKISIVLHGHSMGATTVCEAAGEHDLPLQVRAGVADCPFTDIYNVYAWIFREGARLPVHPFIDLLRCCLKLLSGGYDLLDGSAERAVRTSHIPLIFFHGNEDTLVPAYMSRRLSRACGGMATNIGCQLELVQGAGHCQAMLADPDRYFDKIFEFIGRFDFQDFD